MDYEDNQFIKDILSKLHKVDYIKPEDIPNIDLYMDQVTTFMNEQFESLKRFEDDKMLTKTMINNYTKNNLLPPPNKKKYSKEHMFLLIFIYYLKSMISISDIKEILNPLTDMYFEGKNGIDFTSIYEDLCKMVLENTDHLSKDIVKKYQGTTEYYEDKGYDKSDKDFLSRFTFICLLCVDVYMKKTLIEKLIDESFLRKYTDSDKEKNI